jgi:4-aminobutyrate aminotransferase-like enzyme/Ser/Thr protein kinase RdoA (MazF antagonist)
VPSTPHPPAESVLEARAPAFSADEAAVIAQQVFGIDSAAHALDSERDQNFRLDAADGRQWVLKITNPAEDPAVLDLQSQALAHIADVDPGLAVPRVRPALDGVASHEVEGADGRRFITRVLSFLPGELLGAVEASPALRQDVGAVAARLGRALSGFFHPAARHELLWDIMQAPALRRHTRHIQETDRRHVVEDVFDHLEAVVLPLLRGKRAQVIHNDLGGQNTLVDGEIVIGSIDFGDLIHAPLVCDLAVPISELIAGSDDPMAAAGEIVAGYHAVTPLADDELRLIFDVVVARCAMNLAIAAWRVGDHPENTDYIMSGADEFWRLLQLMREWGPDLMYARLRHACEVPSLAAPRPQGQEDPQAFVDRRLHRLGPGLSLTYDRPLHLVRGEGVWLIDTSGNAFLDAYNNVPQVGHCHPAVVAALADQAATLNTNTRYHYEPILEYADRLTATMPGDLSVCLFVCSGSEANDLAWRLAKAHSGNAGAIAIEHAYHGTTDAVFEISPAEHGDGRPLADHVAVVPAPDGYRGRFRRDDPLHAENYAACLDDAITSLHSRGLAPAAFYLDLILSSSGIMVPPPGYLSAAFEKVRAAGGLCVADEVQSGFGRTGDHFWGFSAHDVVPDIVTLGKPIGNGYAMGAVVTKPAIVKSLIDQSGFFSTTGGSPVACRVGLAVLDVLEDEQLQAQAFRVGAQLRSELEALAQKHSLIGDVRGAGLFIGVELVNDHTTLEPATAAADAVVNHMRDNGVLVGIDGPHGNVVKIRPPLVFDETHAGRLIAAFDRALVEV